MFLSVVLFLSGLIAASSVIGGYSRDGLPALPGSIITRGGFYLIISTLMSTDCGQQQQPSSRNLYYSSAVVMLNK